MRPAPTSVSASTAGTLLWTTDGLLKALLIVGVCQVCLHYADLYDLRGAVDLIDLTVAADSGARRGVADPGAVCTSGFPI